MGGVPVFVSILLTIVVWMYGEDLYEIKYLLIGLIIVFVIGLRDDLIPMKPVYKLVNQLIPSFLVIFYFDVTIISFYGLFDQVVFPDFVKWIVSLVTIIVITNSYNLIDGIDGLAGSVGVLAMILFGGWFYIVGNSSASLLCFGFVGGFLAFLYYNWQPSKIFMGDTGALLIGFFIACLVILFLNTNHDLKNSDLAKFQNPISLALAILIIPLLDTLRVFIIRIMHKRSPFSPDNSHMHHKLLKCAFSHAKAVYFLLSINILFIIIIILLRKQHEVYSLMTIIGLSLLVTFFLSDKVLSKFWKIELLSKSQTKKTTIE